MTLNNHHWEAWKPGVPKSVLLIVAAMVWTGTAIMLNVISYSWLRTETFPDALLAAIAGLVSALIIHHFGFLRIVDRNLGRIHAMEGRRCVFAFMPWKSYLLVAVMVLMGVFLRHSPVPKVYLAVLYAAIGTALFLSSVRYLRHAIRAIKNTGKEEACLSGDDDPQ
jgi:hypothetical protein